MLASAHMNRVSIVLLAAAAAACGGNKPKPTTTPLPADQPVAEAPKPDPTPAPEPAPQQLPPLEVKVPAPTVTVKLVSGGRGKKAPIRYTVAAGSKQQVELAMDFSSKQTMEGQTEEQVVPTVVLTGEAEAKAAGADGKTEYALAVASTDARDVKGSQIPVDKFKVALASLSGLVISGAVDANGTAGDVTLRIEKPDPLSAGALDLIRLTLPQFPVLPKEPVGVGAKWQATTSAKLADKLDVTQVTTYELTAKKGTTYTIKGTTKVTGKDQDVAGGKISKISGSGTSQVTLVDGQLFPAHTSSLETAFTASEGDKSMQFSIRVGGAVTPKTGDAAAPAPAGTTGTTPAPAPGATTSTTPQQ